MKFQVLADSVEPQRISGTTTFENLLGITDSKTLLAKEAGITYITSVELFAKPHLVTPFDFSFSHLKAIHKHLFNDLYEWAGQPRSFDMAKSNDIFTPAAELAKYEEDVFRPAKLLYQASHRSSKLSREEVVVQLAKSLGLVNKFHPFPEGNGRTQRVYVYSLACELGYSVNWEKVETWEMVEVCRRAHEGDYKPIEIMMDRVLARRN